MFRRNKLVRLWAHITDRGFYIREILDDNYDLHAHLNCGRDQYHDIIECTVPDVFCNPAQTVRGRVHLDTTNDDEINELGNDLIRAQDSILIKGRRHNNVYGLVLIDYGVKELACFEDVGGKLDWKTEEARADLDSLFGDHNWLIMAGASGIDLYPLVDEIPTIAVMRFG